MFQPFHSLLASGQVRFVLASASPRRKDILRDTMPEIGFDIVPSTAEENLDKGHYKGRPWQYAVDTAKLKAAEVFQRLKVAADSKQNLVVVGADTIVTYQGEIYGKPKDHDAAVRTLQTLSGNKHQVYTGVVIMMTSLSDGADDVITREFHEKTDVEFDALEEAVIKAYVESGEPMDKAGGYGIQARGGTLVKKIDGCYFNVAGFPAHHFAKQLRSLLLVEQNQS